MLAKIVRSYEMSLQVHKPYQPDIQARLHGRLAEQVSAETCGAE